MNIRIFKKSQIIVISLAIIMMTIGYLNYGSQTVKTVAEAESEENRSSDVQLVSSISTEDVDTNNMDRNNVEISNSAVENTNSDNIKNGNNIGDSNTNTQNVNSNASSENSSDYFVNTRMERDKMYSQMIDTYQNIIDSTSISNEQKAIATEEINKITNIKNAIMIAENLIKSKGFEDVVILINDNSVNVIIKKSKLSTPEVSQIQNIISRELNTEIRRYSYSK